MRDISREVSLPFTHGSVSLKAVVNLPDDSDMPNRTVDCIFRVGTRFLNEKGTATATAIVEALKLDDGHSEGSQVFTFTMQDDVSIELTLSASIDKDVDANVLLFCLAQEIVPAVLAHAAQDMISSVAMPALNASGYSERMARMSTDALISKLESMAGVRGGGSLGDLDFDFMGMGARGGSHFDA